VEKESGLLVRMGDMRWLRLGVYNSSRGRKRREERKDLHQRAGDQKKKDFNQGQGSKGPGKMVLTLLGARRRSGKEGGEGCGWRLSRPRTNVEKARRANKKKRWGAKPLGHQLIRPKGNRKKRIRRQKRTWGLNIAKALCQGASTRLKASGQQPRLIIL